MTDVRGSLMLDAEWENHDPSWEDEQCFELADIDLQRMAAMGASSEDLTVEEDQLRYRQYLARKQ